MLKFSKNKKTIFLLTILFGFFGMVKSSEATPTISSVSGAVSDGGSVTISGSDFGVHNDYSPTEPYLAAAWDNLDDGTANSSVFDIGLYGPELWENEAEQRANSEYCSRNWDAEEAPITYNNLFNNSVTIPSTIYGAYYLRALNSYSDEVWLSAWFMLSESGMDAMTAIDSTSQIKTLSVVTDNDPIMGNIYWGFSAQQGGYGHATASCEFTNNGVSNSANPDDLRINNLITDIIKVDEWHRFSLYANQSNYYFYMDEKLYHTGPVAPNPQEYTTYFHRYVNNRDYGVVWYTFADDYYSTNSRARLELCDESIWDDTQIKHCEIQIPTFWTDEVITIDVNQGSFNIGDSAYFFAIDENGDVSDGYPVTFTGASDTTPPSAPSGLGVS